MADKRIEENGKCYCSSPTCKYYNINEHKCDDCGLPINGTAMCHRYEPSDEYKAKHNLELGGGD